MVSISCFVRVAKPKCASCVVRAVVGKSSHAKAAKGAKVEKLFPLAVLCFLGVMLFDNVLRAA